MPCSISYEENVDCCLVHWSGAVSFADAAGYYRAIAEQDWFKPGLKILHDFRKTNVRLSEAEVAQIDDIYREVGAALNESKTAAIVSESLAFDLGQSQTPLAAGDMERIRVVPSFEAARAWLELPEDYLDPFAGPADRKANLLRRLWRRRTGPR